MIQSQQIPMTFQRYETKYMLSPIMARKLRKSLPGHLQMDEYGLDTICSLYYDTPDHQLIRRSLEKPVYKEKLRLRSYVFSFSDDSPMIVRLLFCWNIRLRRFTAYFTSLPGFTSFNSEVTASEPS